MPAADFPRPARKAGEALIFAPIFGGLIALCHLGGLAGAVVPLFLSTASKSNSHLAITFVTLAHHIVALVTAAMLLIGLRTARVGLLLVIALSIAHSLFILPISPVIGVVAFGFGLLLYIPPLALIYWRPEEFR